MKDHLRRAVAGITAALVNEAEYSSIYDFAGKKHAAIAVRVVDGKVEAYDRFRLVHIAGPLPNGVYDFGDGAHIEFHREGDVVKGFDHGSQTFYEARVNGAEVQVYDYETGAHHDFRVA